MTSTRTSGSLGASGFNGTYRDDLPARAVYSEAAGIGRGVIVDVSRLDAIGAPDPVTRRIVVGTGAIRNRLDERARAAGLRFPVDPSSGAFCTIGGMVSTNAAGARSLRYGSTRRWVRALDCVFADGSRATF